MIFHKQFYDTGEFQYSILKNEEGQIVRALILKKNGKTHRKLGWLEEPYPKHPSGTRLEEIYTWTSMSGIVHYGLKGEGRFLGTGMLHIPEVPIT